MNAFRQHHNRPARHVAAALGLVGDGGLPPVIRAHATRSRCVVVPPTDARQHKRDRYASFTHEVVTPWLDAL
jgi:hypothetical protein